MFCNNSGMVYFIFGNQSAIIKQRIKTITKEVLGDDKCDMNYVRFIGRDTLVQEVVSECNYLPLGFDKKIVILEHAYFLSTKKERNKLDSEQDYKCLIDYINHPSDIAELIITLESNDVDSRNKVYQALKEHATILQASDPDKETWRSYVKSYFTQTQKVRIDNDAVDEIALRCEGDVVGFQNHAKKLALYTDHVTYDDVCLFVPRPLEDNIYDIYNFLILNRNDEAIRLYRDIISTGEVEVVYIISTLARQFRTLYQVMYLSKTSHSVDEIATILGKKTFAIQKDKKRMYSISESVILKTLDELFNLDYNIKSGMVDRFYAFELFLINFKAE